MFTISRFLIFKSTTENSLCAEIKQVTNFGGLKLEQQPKLVIEIGGLNLP
jgi:hypothetical protein